MTLSLGSALVAVRMVPHQRGAGCEAPHLGGKQHVEALCRHNLIACGRTVQGQIAQGIQGQITPRNVLKGEQLDDGRDAVLCNQGRAAAGMPGKMVQDRGEGASDPQGSVGCRLLVIQCRQQPCLDHHWCNVAVVAELVQRVCCTKLDACYRASQLLDRGRARCLKLCDPCMRCQASGYHFI